ncbi:1-hydroxycarotenoid 3,4-desaturase CrtD [Halocola ammonii]
MRNAIIIGAGIAGLASALRLRNKGFEVDVFEANSYAGGKIHAQNLDGFRFDMGPSLFTMPHLVDELFRLFGKNPRDFFNYRQKETICNYFWSDGTRFSASADKQQFVDQAAKTFDESSEKIEKYLNRNAEKYELTADIFLKKSLHNAKTYLSVNTLKSLLKSGRLDIGKSLNQVNEIYFDHPKLVQLFNRFATYNGSSPYSTPGIMSMIPHLEMELGTYFPEGGMHEISQSLYRLAKEQGINFHFNSKVEKILLDDKKAKGVRANGVDHLADVVVSNVDVFSTYKHLLKEARQPKKILSQERSSSAIIFYWGINNEFPQFDLHNILFSDNYKEEFESIFETKKLFDDPTVYINISSKEETRDAPKGCENWFVMINVPVNEGQYTEEVFQQARKYVIHKIQNTLGVDITQHIVTENRLDPISIESNTNSHGGSLYGTSSNSKFAAFLRHPNFSSSVKNLYFCGGSVHPGGGIPLCLLSAKIATNEIPSA